MQREIVPKKYIEVDSTYRNRNEYPDPGEFQIPILNQGQTTNSANARDAVSNGSSNHFWSGRQNVTVNVAGVPSAIQVTSLLGTEQIFKGQFVTLSNGEESLVTFYSPRNQVVYLETPFNEFDIYASYGPLVPNTAQIVNPSTKTKILMFKNITSFDGQFVDQYLTNLTRNENRKIINYSSKFKTIDVDIPFTNPNKEDIYLITKDLPLTTSLTTLPAPPSVSWGYDSNGQYIIIPGGDTVTDNIYQGKYLNLYSFDSGNLNIPISASPIVRSYEAKYTKGIYFPRSKYNKIRIFNYYSLYIFKFYKRYSFISIIFYRPKF